MSTINDLIQNIQRFHPFKELSAQLLDFVADVKGKLWTLEILTKNLNEMLEQFSASTVPTIGPFFKAYIGSLFNENTHKIQKYCFTMLMSLLIYKERYDYLKLYFFLFTTETDNEVYGFFAETKRMCLSIRQIAEQKFTNLDGIFMPKKQCQIVINKCLGFGVEQIKQFETELQTELTRLKHNKGERLVKYCRSGEYSLNFFLKECLKRFSDFHRQLVEERSQELEEYKQKVKVKLEGDYGPLMRSRSKSRSTKLMVRADGIDDISPEDEALAKQLEKHRLVEEIKSLTCLTNKYKVSSAKLMGYAVEIDPFFEEIKRLVGSTRDALLQIKREKVNGKAFEAVSGQATTQMLALLDRGSKLSVKGGNDLKNLLMRTNAGFYKKLVQRETEFRPGIRKMIRDMKTIVFSDRFSITLNRDAKNLEKVKDELEKLFNKFDKLENSEYLILDTVFRNYDSRNKRETVLDNATNNAAAKLGNMVNQVLLPKIEEPSLPQDRKFSQGRISKALKESELKSANENSARDLKISKASIAKEQEEIIKEFETSKAKHDSLVHSLGEKAFGNETKGESSRRLAEREESPGFGENDEEENSPQDEILSKEDKQSSDEEKQNASKAEFQKSTGLSKTEDVEKYVDRIQREANELQKRQQAARQQEIEKRASESRPQPNAFAKEADQRDLYSFRPNDESNSFEGKAKDASKEKNKLGSPPTNRAENPFIKKKKEDQESKNAAFEPLSEDPFKRKSSKNRQSDLLNNFENEYTGKPKKESIGPRFELLESKTTSDKNILSQRLSKDQLGKTPISDSFKILNEEEIKLPEADNKFNEFGNKDDWKRQRPEEKRSSRLNGDSLIKANELSKQSSANTDLEIFPSEERRLSQSKKEKARAEFDYKEFNNEQNLRNLNGNLSNSQAHKMNFNESLNANNQSKFPAQNQQTAFNPRFSGATNFNPRLSNQIPTNPLSQNLRTSATKAENLRGSKIEEINRNEPAQSLQRPEAFDADLKQSKEKFDLLKESSKKPVTNFNPRLSDSQGLKALNGPAKTEALVLNQTEPQKTEQFGQQTRSSKGPGLNDSKRHSNNNLVEDYKIYSHPVRGSFENKDAVSEQQHNKNREEENPHRGSKQHKDELRMSGQQSQPFNPRLSADKGHGVNESGSHGQRPFTDSHQAQHKDSRTHLPLTLGDSQAENRPPKPSLKSDKRPSLTKIPHPAPDQLPEAEGRPFEWGNNSRQNLSEEEHSRPLRVSKDKAPLPNPFEPTSGGTLVDSKPFSGNSGLEQKDSQKISSHFPNPSKREANLITSLKDSFGRNEKDDYPAQKLDPHDFSKNITDNGQTPELLSDYPANGNDKKNLPLFSSFGDQKSKQKNSVVKEAFSPEDVKEISEVKAQKRFSDKKVEPNLRESVGRQIENKQDLLDSGGKPVNLLLSSDLKEKDPRQLAAKKSLGLSQVEEPAIRFELKNLDSTGEMNELVENTEVPSMVNSLQKSQLKGSLGNDSHSQGPKGADSRPANPKFSDSKPSSFEPKVSGSKASPFEKKGSGIKGSEAKLSDIPLDPKISEITAIERPPFESKFTDLRLFDPKMSEPRPLFDQPRFSDPRPSEPQNPHRLSSKPSEPKLADSKHLPQPQSRPSDPALRPPKVSGPSLSQSDVNTVREPQAKALLRNVDSRGESDAIIPEAQVSQLNSLSGRLIAQHNSTNLNNNNTLNTTAVDNYDVFRQNLEKELKTVQKADTIGQPSFMKSGSKGSQPSQTLNDLIDRNEKIEELSNEDFLTDLKAPSQADQNEPNQSSKLKQSKDAQSLKQSEALKKAQESKYGQQDESGHLRSIKRPKGQAIAKETGIYEPEDKSIKNYFKGFFGKRNE